MNIIIVNGGIIIIPSLSCIVVNFNIENMSSGQSSLVKKILGTSNIVIKTRKGRFKLLNQADVSSISPKIYKLLTN